MFRPLIFTEYLHCILKQEPCEAAVLAGSKRHVELFCLGKVEDDGVVNALLAASEGKVLIRTEVFYDTEVGMLDAGFLLGLPHRGG